MPIESHARRLRRIRRELIALVRQHRVKTREGGVLGEADKARASALIKTLSGLARGRGGGVIQREDRLRYARLLNSAGLRSLRTAFREPRRRGN